MADFPASSYETNWGLVGSVAVIIAAIILVIWSIGSTSAKIDDCEKAGGTYMRGGKYGDPTCIKDGKIVIIWQNGRHKVENPIIGN